MSSAEVLASFDVDAQKGFTPLCPDELPVPGGDAIGAALNQLASRAALRLGSKDAHSPKAAWVVESAEQMLRPLAYPDADLPGSRTPANASVRPWGARNTSCISPRSRAAPSFSTAACWRPDKRVRQGR